MDMQTFLRHYLLAKNTAKDSKTALQAGLKNTILEEHSGMTPTEFMIGLTLWQKRSQTAPAPAPAGGNGDLKKYELEWRKSMEEAKQLCQEAIESVSSGKRKQELIDRLSEWTARKQTASAH